MTETATPGGTLRGRTPSSLLGRALMALATGVHRLRGEKRTVLLTTVGAETGRPRSTPVRRVAEESGAILAVASEAGPATPPGWFVDMVRNPDAVWIDENGRRVRVTPTALHGEERAEAWRRIVAEAPYHGTDEDAKDPRIPVVRLTPVE